VEPNTRQPTTTPRRSTCSRSAPSCWSIASSVGFVYETANGYSVFASGLSTAGSIGSRHNGRVKIVRGQRYDGPGDLGDHFMTDIVSASPRDYP